LIPRPLAAGSFIENITKAKFFLISKGYPKNKTTSLNLRNGVRH
jgi:hypothetical protein